MVHMRKINNKGFSLVEVIISIAILAIISIPLLNYFTDSMKHNALAKTRQEATLEAQSIMEQLKAEDKLLKPDATGTSYLSPFFSTKELTFRTPGGMEADGSGQLEYFCAAGTLSSQFDVEVVLSATSAYNEVHLPVIYGIDETKDVLAIEKDQFVDAKSYFEAICAGAGRTGVVDVEANITRNMRIEFEKDGAEVNVKIYYIYQCRDLTAGGSVHDYTSTVLADVNLASVKNVYLLFNRCNRAPNNELVTIVNPDRIALPHIYLFNQKLVPDPGYYTKNIAIHGLEYSEKAAHIIHVDADSIAADGDGEFDNVYDEVVSPTGIKISPLDMDEQPIRLIDIKVTVYPKGTFEADGSVPVSADEYVVLNSTKGE